MTLLLLFVSVFPVILIGLYIYKKDKDKEPKSLLLGLFMSGFLSAMLVVIIDAVISFVNPEFSTVLEGNNLEFYKLFCTIFFEIALVEEFSKWLMIRFIGYNNKEFDELYDIIVYSVFVALGFAMVENIFYVLPGGLSLGLFRALFSVPGHASFGIFMGAFFGLAKIYEKKDKYLSNLYMIFAILVPTLLHTFYNFCLITGEAWFLLMFVVFIIALYISAIIYSDRISKDDKLL